MEDGAAQPRARRSRLALAAAAFALLPALPWLGKAFHVDDALMLRIVENVLADPLRPFAGSFDFVGRVMLVRDLATNPPGISYWLAPFVAIGGEREALLHAAMLVFPLLLAASLPALARPLGAPAGLAIALALSSPAVVVGLNVMQDVPAAALSAAAVAAFGAGLERGRTRLVALGAACAALALACKYSAIAVVPVLALQALVHGAPRAAAWTLVPLGALGAWALHGLAVDGAVHFAAVSGRSYGPGVAWRQNLAALAVVAGASSFLAPALLALAAARRAGALAAAALAGAALAVGLDLALGAGRLEAQRAFWAGTGGALLGAVALQGARDAARWLRDPRDRAAGHALVLAAWIGAVAGFSVLFAPFPAMRHLTPALAPIVVLALRALAPLGTRGATGGLAATVALQLAAAELVACADAEHAGLYRSLAGEARRRADEREVAGWFTGTWGWLHYARRAGLEQAHPGRGRPRPAPGALVAWTLLESASPRLPNAAALGVPLRVVEERTVPARLPLRTQHRLQGAGFYALVAEPDAPPPVPYRLVDPAWPLERFTFYEVAPR